MDHDYTHCLDFAADCPRECFRARLAIDLKNNSNDMPMFLSYAHLENTEYCEKSGG